jgi:hypothetical protein
MVFTKSPFRRVSTERYTGWLFSKHKIFVPSRKHGYSSGGGGGGGGGVSGKVKLSTPVDEVISVVIKSTLPLVFVIINVLELYEL